MKRHVLIAAASVCYLAFLTAGTASAQAAPYARPGFSPYNRPQLSPYLNMLRGGDPAANYYLGVVPERQRRRNDALFRSEIYDLEQRTQPAAEGEDVVDRFVPLRATGHATAFGTTGSYFGSSGMQQPMVTRPPTQQTARPVRR
jgi:hypothetical protein